MLLAVIALRLLWRLKQCLRWMTRRGGDDPLLAPGAARSDDAAQVAGGLPFVRRQVSVGHLTTSQLRTLLGRVGIDAKDTVEDRDGLLALLTARGVTHVNADGSPLVAATRHV